MIVSTNLSIRDSPYPELTCFGCGHTSPHGFRLRSYRTATWPIPPRREDDNGLGFVNGGISHCPGLSRRSCRQVGNRQTGMEDPCVHSFRHHNQRALPPQARLDPSSRRCPTVRHFPAWRLRPGWG